MPSRPAISFSAAAISSACARLSIWQGPANTAIGRSLANVTLPMVTVGFGFDESLMPALYRMIRELTYRPPGSISPVSYAPVDDHIQQLWAGRGKSSPQRRRQRVGLGDALGGHAHRLGKAGEVHLWVREVHADEMVAAVEGLEALLDDAIAAVVGDYVGDGQLQVRRCPERLDRVHGAAVARETAHLTRGLRQRNADRGGERPADTARRQSVIAVAITVGHEVGQIAPGGQPLVDEHGIARQRLGDLQVEPVGIDRRRPAA